MTHRLSLVLSAALLCACGATVDPTPPQASPDAATGDVAAPLADAGPDSPTDAADASDADTCGACQGPDFAACVSCEQAQRCGYTPACPDGGWLDSGR